MNQDKLEVIISRKPNYGSSYLKGLPISKNEKERMYGLFGKIENTIMNRNNFCIEDIRELL